MTDQQRYDTIGACGNPIIRTPALDKICNEGALFSRAYTPSPVCVPARHALMTGLPPHITGCFDNAIPGTEHPGFVEKLAEAGYQTHAVGKMHFVPDPLKAWGFQSRDVSEELEEAGDQDDYRAYLADAGFGHVCEPHGFRSEYYYTPQPSQLPEELHHSHWVADRSITFLANRDTTRPFFLKASFVKPHPPFESPEPWARLYRMTEMSHPYAPAHSRTLWTYWNQVQNRYKYTDGGDSHYLARLRKAAYFGCISFLDHQIGRLLDALGNQIDQTLVVFCSDHGELLGDYGCYGKRSMLDAACRIPLIARWPGHFKAGSVVETPASLLDLFPTFTAAGDTDCPRPSPEGEDLRKIAAGTTNREVVYSQFQRGEYALYMAATDRDKYIYSAPDRSEYYLDRDRDPLESRNMINDAGSVARTSDLRSRLVRRHQHDSDAVENDAFREYPNQCLALDVDEGLLFQDSSRLQESVNALPDGYSRNVSVSDGSANRLLDTKSKPH